MKKIILSLALLIGLCVGAVAQTKVIFKNGPIGLDVKFKRSFLHGNTLVVDFVIENNTGKDMNCQIMMSGNSMSTGHIEIKAYDDEGNVYTEPSLGGHTRFGGSIGGKSTLYEWASIPQGNLIKVRLQIPDVDEYATTIKTLTIPMRVCPNGTINEVYGELRVSNIPIPHE